MRIITGNIIDIHNREVFYGVIKMDDLMIESIERIGNERKDDIYIAPGLIDSHVHIESSMLVPSVFSEMVIPCGTIGVVCDPHEIANVMGVDGVEYMMKDAKKTPLKFYFGIPSCVPATNLESNGGSIDASDIDYLFKQGAWFLAEMMNYPGVLNGEPAVLEKIGIAKRYNKPIDGHAPGLKGEGLEAYVKAGISTDHECSTIEEALQRIELGMFVQIREGSAARNFNQLYSLLNTHSTKVMLCTDDSHPDDIFEKGHIDKIVRMALKKGVSIFDIYQSALVNPVLHYQLPVGMLRVGDCADFIIIDNIDNFKVLSTYINGEAVYDNGILALSTQEIDCVNIFTNSYISLDQISVVSPVDHPLVKVIDVMDGELLTNEYSWLAKSLSGFVLPSMEEDVAKIVVVNRYAEAKPSVGFVRGFGIKDGAFGATVAHDSHNIVVVGMDDESIYEVINELFKQKGGVVAYCQGDIEVLPLPVAGLMSNEKGSVVAARYARLNNFVCDRCKTRLQAPFMTLSFLSLLVIPSLKIGDKGLFDVNRFCYVDLIS